MCKTNNSVVVSGIPPGVAKEHLRLHFESERNHGGKIDGIIFPFTGDDTQALIIFRDPESTLRITQFTQRLSYAHGRIAELEVRGLPRQVISTMYAHVNPDLQRELEETNKLVDVVEKLRCEAGLDDLSQGSDGRLIMVGNWYQIQNGRQILQEYCDAYLGSTASSVTSSLNSLRLDQNITRAVSTQGFVPIERSPTNEGSRSLTRESSAGVIGALDVDTDRCPRLKTRSLSETSYSNTRKPAITTSIDILPSRGRTPLRQSSQGALSETRAIPSGECSSRAHEQTKTLTFLSQADRRRSRSLDRRTREGVTERRRHSSSRTTNDHDEYVTITEDYDFLHYIQMAHKKELDDICARYDVQVTVTLKSDGGKLVLTPTRSRSFADLASSDIKTLFQRYRSKIFSETVVLGDSDTANFGRIIADLKSNYPDVFIRVCDTGYVYITGTKDKSKAVKRKLKSKLEKEATESSPNVSRIEKNHDNPAYSSSEYEPSLTRSTTRTKNGTRRREHVSDILENSCAVFEGEQSLAQQENGIRSDRIGRQRNVPTPAFKKEVLYRNNFSPRGSEGVDPIKTIHRPRRISSTIDGNYSSHNEQKSPMNVRSREEKTQSDFSSLHGGATADDELRDAVDGVMSVKTERRETRNDSNSRVLNAKEMGSLRPGQKEFHQVYSREANDLLNYQNNVPSVEAGLDHRVSEVSFGREQGASLYMQTQHDHSTEWTEVVGTTTGEPLSNGTTGHAEKHQTVIAKTANVDIESDEDSVSLISPRAMRRSTRLKMETDMFRYMRYVKHEELNHALGSVSIGKIEEKGPKTSFSLTSENREALDSARTKLSTLKGTLEKRLKTETLVTDSRKLQKHVYDDVIQKVNGVTGLQLYIKNRYPNEIRITGDRVKVDQAKEKMLTMIQELHTSGHLESPVLETLTSGDKPPVTANAETIQYVEPDIATQSVDDRDPAFGGKSRPNSIISSHAHATSIRYQNEQESSNNERPPIPSVIGGQGTARKPRTSVYSPLPVADEIGRPSVFDVPSSLQDERFLEISDRPPFPSNIVEQGTARKPRTSVEYPQPVAGEIGRPSAFGVPSSSQDESPHELTDQARIGDGSPSMSPDSIDSSEDNQIWSDGCQFDSNVWAFVQKIYAREFRIITAGFKILQSESGDVTTVTIEAGSEPLCQEAVKKLSDFYLKIQGEVKAFTLDCDVPNATSSDIEQVIFSRDYDKLFIRVLPGKKVLLVGKSRNIEETVQLINQDLGTIFTNGNQSGRVEHASCPDDLEIDGVSSVSNAARHRVPQEKVELETLEGLKILIYSCDITQVKVDAIVNAANRFLANGSGVAGAISQAGGPLFEDACRRCIRHRGRLQVGENAVVNAYGDLLKNCSIVINAVGPEWHKYKSKFRKCCAADLKTTFLNVLDTAGRQVQARSVAIPLISSGIFGVPVDVCIVMLYEAIVEFSRVALRSQRCTLAEIHLVNLSDDITAEIIDAFLNEGRNQRARYLRHGLYTKPDEHMSVDSTPFGKYYDQYDRQVTEMDTDSAAQNIEMDDTSTSYDKTGARPKMRLVSSKLDQTSHEHDTMVDDRQSDHIEDATNKCPICLEDITDVVKLNKCGHEFCNNCITPWLANKPVCPTCGTIYGLVVGTQPWHGQMEVTVDDNAHLPGYESCGVLVIHYAIPPGVQGQEHPNPGSYFHGTTRQAYLPANGEGKMVLYLLRKAFEARLIFTIGRSSTTGAENVVTWNDIHHKTSMYGGPTSFGYPDPTYLQRVTEELAAKGIEYKV